MLTAHFLDDARPVQTVHGLYDCRTAHRMTAEIALTLQYIFQGHDWAVYAMAHNLCLEKPRVSLGFGLVLGFGCEQH